MNIRFAFIFLYLCFFISGAAQAEKNFKIGTPPGWKVVKDAKKNAKGDLVWQILEPNGNAFVEVYANEFENLGLDHFADGWEAHMRANLPGDLKTRICSLDIVVDGEPAVLRHYSGVSESIPSASVILTTYRGGKLYFVFGMWRDDSNELSRPTTLAVTSIRFR